MSSAQTPKKDIVFVTTSYNTAQTPKSENIKPSFDYVSPKADPMVENLGQDLLSGMGVDQVSPEYINDVTLWLRMHKKKILKQPDYKLAKKIDEITSSLQLSNGASQYKSFQKEKIMDYENKLNQATVQLDSFKQKEKEAREANEANRASSLAQLEEKHRAELDELDSQYLKDPPPKYRKCSADVVNMRLQEKHMRDSGLYDEAMEMHNEIVAIEAYELEVKKLQWNQEWGKKRDLLIEHQKQQADVLNDRFDLRWNRVAPDIQRSIKYYEKLIHGLEQRIQNERALQLEAEKATTAVLCPTTNRGLPPLGTKSALASQSNAMSRVVSVCGARTYTRPKQNQRR